MDNRFDDKVLNEMQPFFDEHGFKASQNGEFENEKKAVRVMYNEPRQMYALSVADIVDGKKDDWREINQWLFDDTQNAKDAASVGIDFVNSLRKDMGIKIKRTTQGNEIELPSITKTGSITISGFTKKMLDFFPTLKDEYKNDIAIKGSFLYLNFFGEFLVPQIRSIMISGNKKQIKKLIDLLDDMYVKGDKETVNTIVAVLCASAYNNTEIKTTITEMLESDKHFKLSFESFLPAFSKNKKLLAALIKN